MKLIIKDSGEKESIIDYSMLTLRELDQRLSHYERKYGTFEIFAKQYDCDEGNTNLYTQLLDWENLIREKQKRQQ